MTYYHLCSKAKAKPFYNNSQQFTYKQMHLSRIGKSHCMFSNSLHLSDNYISNCSVKVLFKNIKVSSLNSVRNGRESPLPADSTSKLND